MRREKEENTMDRVASTEPTPAFGTERAKALVLALFCILYLLNLSGGLLEIPDCLPIVGNLDEVAVTVLLLRCLKRLGFDAM